MLDVAPINETITGFRKIGTDSEKVIETDSLDRYKLHELAGEYEFFHHGALLLLSNLEHDPVQAFVDLCTDTPRVFHRTLPRPTFICDFAFQFGLSSLAETPGFDSLVFGIQKDRWPQLCDHLMNVATVYRKARRFCRTLAQVIEVYDPTFIENIVVAGADIPKIKVTTFAADASDSRWGFVAPTSALDNQARLVRVPTNPDTIKLAHAVLGESDKPFRSIESIVDERERINRIAAAAGISPPS